MSVGRPLGYMKPGLEPEERPTIKDIAWAAGFFEGDGHSSYSGITVTQKDRWTLDRLRRLFGGSISKDTGERMGGYTHRWQLSGARGRGFAMTIYPFLSPRRKKQIRKNIFTWIEETR